MERYSERANVLHQARAIVYAAIASEQLVRHRASVPFRSVAPDRLDRWSVAILLLWSSLVVSALVWFYSR